MKTRKSNPERVQPLLESLENAGMIAATVHAEELAKNTISLHVSGPIEQMTEGVPSCLAGNHPLSDYSVKIDNDEWRLGINWYETPEPTTSGSAVYLYGDSEKTEIPSVSIEQGIRRLQGLTHGPNRGTKTDGAPNLIDVVMQLAGRGADAVSINPLSLEVEVARLLVFADSDQPRHRVCNSVESVWTPLDTYEFQAVTREPESVNWKTEVPLYTGGIDVDTGTNVSLVESAKILDAYFHGAGIDLPGPNHV